MNEIIFHYGIPFYNLAYESISNFYNEIVFHCNNIVKGYNSNTLVFYENNPNPYISSFIDTKNKLNALTIWKYDIYYKTFYNYNCLHKDTKYLPILSGIVKLHDKPVIDITDFLTNIRVESSNVNYPSLQHILGAYEYTDGIVLNRSLPYVLEYLDGELNEKTVNLFSNTTFSTNK
jgi:hypothetical protein